MKSGAVAVFGHPYMEVIGDQFMCSPTLMTDSCKLDSVSEFTLGRPIS